MNKLPVIISIPHSGNLVPQELSDRIILTENELFEDIDAYTCEIYNLNEKVEKVILTKIARTFVDLNRAIDELPPKNPYGLIKIFTAQRKQIYVTGKEPDNELIKILIDKYYKPYHDEIIKTINENKNIKIGLDCHSMDPTGPLIAPDTGKRRPLFCLSNLNHNSSSKDIIEKLAFCIQQSFNISQSDVLLNNPFSGGHIIKTYGGKPIPWIQIEINKVLYLGSPWYDYQTNFIDKNRLKELNQMFEKSIYMFIEQINK